MSQHPADPTIDEIREVRHQISERFEHKPERLLEHYMEIQQEYRDRWVGGRSGSTANDIDK